jgi:hypothetical protein
MTRHSKRHQKRKSNRRSRTRRGGIARGDLESQLRNIGFNPTQINSLISSHAPELTDDYAIEGWVQYIRNQVPSRMNAFQFMELLGNDNGTSSNYTSMTNSLNTPPASPPASPPRTPPVTPLPSTPIQDRGPMTMDELGPRSPVGINANFDDFQMGGVNFKTLKPKAKAARKTAKKSKKPKKRTRSTTSSDFGSIYATSSSSPSIGYFMMERHCSPPIITSSDDFASIRTSSSKRGGEPVVPNVDAKPYAYQEPYYDDNTMMGKVY